MKFKVGQKYEVGAFSEKGNIIEIIRAGGGGVFYKTISEENEKHYYFDEISEFASCLKPLKPHCIVIYENGAETVALDKTTGKKAVAKCSPQDTYDFYTGAKLAFERLTGTEEKQQHVNCKCSLKPQYYNGYVQFVKVGCKDLMPCGDFTEGKVYEVKNGRITDDKGWTGGLGARDIVDLNETLGNTFRELKAVKRPAKVGEHVLVVEKNGSSLNEYIVGDVLKIVDTRNGLPYYKKEIGKFMWSNEYVVLEGYEPPKQYFNGKAVCVVKFDSDFTVGKVYEFVDGKTTDDKGTKRPFPNGKRGIETSSPWFKNGFLQLIE